MNKSLVAATLGVSLLVSSATARDLGQQGRVWTIEEPDIRAVLMLQAEEAMSSEAMKLEREDYLPRMEQRLPKFSFPAAQKTELRALDISTVLARDIWAPVPQPNGEVVETLIASAGTRINPLSRITPPGGFIILDGSNPAHVSLMEEVFAWTPELNPVLVSGSPVETAKRIDSPVFYLRPEMEQVFKLRSVPSIVWAGKDENRGLLMVLELSDSDFNVASIAKHYTPLLSDGRKWSDVIPKTIEEDGEGNPQ